MLQDGLATIDIREQCEDHSDDRLACPTVANKAVLAGIGSMQKIRPFTLQVALKKFKTPKTFTFSRRWRVPRTVLLL